MENSQPIAFECFSLRRFSKVMHPFDDPCEATCTKQDTRSCKTKKNRVLTEAQIFYLDVPTRQSIWRNSSKKILRKCLRYIRLFFGRGCSRMIMIVDDIGRRSVRIKSVSLQETQRESDAYSMRQMCYLDSPIEDAILHCKRSIGK